MSFGGTFHGWPSGCRASCPARCGSRARLVEALDCVGISLPCGTTTADRHVRAFVEELRRRDTPARDSARPRTARRPCEKHTPFGTLIGTELANAMTSSATRRFVRSVTCQTRDLRVPTNHDALRARSPCGALGHDRVELDLEAGRQLDLGQLLPDRVGLRPALRNGRPVDRRGHMDGLERLERAVRHGGAGSDECGGQRRCAKQPIASCKSPWFLAVIAFVVGLRRNETSAAARHAHTDKTSSFSQDMKSH